MKLIQQIEKLINDMPDGQEFLSREIADMVKRPVTSICSSLNNLESQGLISISTNKGKNKIWAKGNTGLDRAWNKFTRMKL